MMDMMVEENICIKREPIDLGEMNSSSNDVTIKEEFTETFVNSEELYETLTKSKNTSCGSQISKFKQLGFVFGSQITEFDKDVLPKEYDVVSLWISKFEQARKEKWHISLDKKHEVIEDIVQSLIFIWQSQNIPILPAQRIKNDIVKLTKRTKYIAKNYKSKLFRAYFKSCYFYN